MCTFRLYTIRSYQLRFRVFLRSFSDGCRNRHRLLSHIYDRLRTDRLVTSEESSSAIVWLQGASLRREVLLRMLTVRKLWSNSRLPIEFVLCSSMKDFEQRPTFSISEHISKLRISDSQSSDQVLPRNLPPTPISSNWGHRSQKRPSLLRVDLNPSCRIKCIFFLSY
ncbi:hypothetical protein PBCV1_a046R [Paramecium bursaria Chlorella virus 1]|uniref:Uncharacterized protein n=1 Tax=Paramecium bursaria Chlorella virus 1 TaxID=10506 RepID=Q89381_PBCV1|nr:hypothetical protein PBCV1_a046R [Paramecium bursaria Chlorella virus 1]AAC96414.1 hypothetical protein [Paramecium bursaria Chlorella virus 1]